MLERLLSHGSCVALTATVVTVLAGCSSSAQETPNSVPNAGGTSAIGGNGSNATGGATGSGGVASVTGGTSGVGGAATGGAASTTGGTSMTVGGAATGGMATGGANSATGGTAANFGGKATGGASTVGGSSATGGSATGGSTSPGTGGGSSTTCTADEEKKFSFFLLSQAALQRESGQVDGYGGDLGGLAGADAICQRVAERSSPCQKSKTWRAFLSTATVNAKDRIGTGPWYDRLGRLLATNMTNLLTERPTGADTAIVNDFPNEDGVPNHSPDGTQVDNHEILTGTGTDGNVYKQSTSSGFGETACGTTSSKETWSVEAATCWGWTTKEGKGCPRVGHSWPRQGSGIGWISVWNESGCAPGGTISETMMTDGRRVVGSYGGYGGFYCFAVTGP